MRKDVKIIMAICVIVLVGLIVYALFLPGEKKSPVAATENAAENSTTQPTETTNAEPTAQPGENAIAIAPTTAPSEMAMSGNAAVTPTPTPTAAAPASGDWNKLLETGSATPDATSSMSGGPVAPSSAGTNVGISAAGAGTAGAMALSSTPMPESTAGSSSENGMGAAANTAAAQRIYIVKSGDTPSSIAQAEYGNRQLYTKILAANPKLNARHMHVGQKIILPALSGASSKSEKTRVSSVVAEDTNGGPAESASGSSANSAAPAEPGSRYTVVAGDSLQRISTKVYGSSAQWQKIYNLNKSKIGPNPARLRAGMVLILPKARTKTAASATETPAATPAVSVDTSAGMSDNGAAR